MKNKGISLIVLVITIIVIIILATSIILSLSKNNPISSASEAEFKHSVNSLNSELSLWLSQEYVNSNGNLDVSTINVSTEDGGYNNKKINDILKSINSKYINEFEIQSGKLVYVGNNLNYKNWTQDIGIDNGISYTTNWVYVGQGETYTTIQQALDAEETRIIIKNGTYNISTHILINNDNVVLRGESKEGVIIVQQSSINDGIVVRGNNVTVENLTVDARTHNAKAAVVQGDCNNITLQNTIIYGAGEWFAIFFSGKTLEPGDVTVQAVENNNLDCYNKLLNNTIYSDWDGDSVAFCLQKNGTISNNTINGGKLAFYMCRDSIASYNVINNSVSNGIYYSTPAYDNIIRNNTINNSLASGIKITTQYEHPVPDTYRASNLLVENNLINSTRFSGIEVDQIKDSIIQNNDIRNIDASGIYLLRVSNVEVKENTIKNVGYGTTNGSLWGWPNTLNMGIMLDFDVSNSNITHNNLINEDINAVMTYGIKVMPNDNNKDYVLSHNKITGNNVTYVDFESNGLHTEFINNIRE